MTATAHPPGWPGPPDPDRSRSSAQPSLVFEPDGYAGIVRLSGLDRHLMQALSSYRRDGGPLPAILRVAVIPTQAREGDVLSAMSGSYEMADDGIRFMPAFPFELGLPYQARFDPGPLGYPGSEDVWTLEVCLPREPRSPPASVTHIFPSSGCLPENLLRFYVCFSRSMQRGRAETEIVLLGPDGEPVADALYRAPLELWDRGMRCLTILLDPGRLKRRVGPNRALGPPLREGQTYTLRIGAGMAAPFEGQRAEPAYKSFRVIGAVREAVEPALWRIGPLAAGSLQPLRITFPRPLDWALLQRSIKVEAEDGRPIDGNVTVSTGEQGWAFAPRSPWLAGSYRIRVDAGLEDTCGNSVGAAFDRPLRRGSALVNAAAMRAIPFDVA